MSNQEIIEIHPYTWLTLVEDGCDVAERCGECPLRWCRFDDESRFRWAVRYCRDLTMVAVLEHFDYNYGLVARLLETNIRSLYLAERHVRRFPEQPINDREFRAVATLPGQKYRSWAAYFIERFDRRE